MNMTCTLCQIYEGHKIKEDYVGGACSAHGGRPEISIKY